MKKILHLGDLHFKLFQDLERVLEVIQVLEKSIINNNIELIYIGGDVVHDYNKYSPEQLQLLILFFKTITNHCPLVMIAGNHDWNNNIDRLDALTPIINFITPKYEIHFLKESGSYNLYNINWWVWSDLDKKEFEKIKFENNKVTIGCYHGTVNGSKLHNGQTIDKGFSLDNFKDCDVVMLADIHLRQFFRDNQIVFPGSLYQVDWGETNDENKGGIIWEFKNNTYKPKPLNLETTYFLYTININNCYSFKLDNKYLDKLYTKYKNLKLRLIFNGNKDLYNKEIFRNYVRELKKYSLYNINTKKIFIKSEIDIKNIATKDFFLEYFKLNEFKNHEIELLKELDLEYNTKIKIENKTQNIVDIEYHEIENFGPFGKTQKIDFSKLDGLIGITAKNQTGKTFLLESILYSLTNFTLKNTNKKKYLINKYQENSAKLKTILSANNSKYKIEKQISFEDDNKINFEISENDNDYISGNEKKQSDTLKKINNTIIDYDNLVLSNFYSNMNGTRFLNLKQGDRFNYFTSILNLDSYEEKYKLSNEDLKLLKINNDQNNNLIEQYENEIKSLETKLEQLLLDKKIFNFTYDKKELINELEKVKENFYSINTDDIIDLDIKKINLETNKFNIEKQTLILNDKLLQQNNLEVELKDNNLDEIIYLKIPQEYYTQLEQLKLEINNLRNIRCLTCKRLFENINEEENNKQIEIKRFEQQKLENLILYEENRINALKSKYNIYNKTKDDIIKVKSLINKIETENIIIESEIKKFNKDKKLLEKKNNLKLEISLINDKIKLAEKEKLKYDIIINDINKTENIIEYKNSEIKKIKNKLIDLEKQSSYLENYVKSMDKKGIRALIINSKVESINNFLEEMLLDFNFNLELFINEKNEIEVYFYDDSGEQQLASLCSGMESFLIDLSLKNAFNQVSQLNKLNLFIIDEGFGVLDTINLELMYNFLNRLKKYNDKILIVSHIDSLKNIYDYNLELEKEGLYTVIK